MTEVKNVWVKPKQWPYRPAYARLRISEPSDWKHKDKLIRPKPVEIQIVVQDLDMHGLPFVRCIVEEYRGISPKKMDGAFIFIRPGGFTPTQFVETPHKF